MAGHLLLALFFLALFILLTIYFFYTVVAVFRGAAYVPTTHSRVERLIDIANIKPGEKLLDLGSGDGRILFAAANKGARCVGIEINPLLCAYSKLLAKWNRVKDVCIERTNFWGVDISDVDILTVYLVPIRLEELRIKALKEMKSGSRIVTAVHHFREWVPEKHIGDICLYRIP